MRYEQTLKIITRGYFNLKQLLMLRKMLGKVDYVAATTGVSIKEVVIKLLDRAGGNWYDLDEVFTQASKSESLVAAKYLIVAEMAMEEIKKIAGTIKDAEEEQCPAYICSIIVNSRIYCSNLFKAIDIFTNIYTSLRVNKHKEGLRNAIIPDETRKLIMLSMDEQSALSSDVSTAITECGISQSDFDKITEGASKLLIVGDLIIDDVTLYKEYCSRISKDCRDLLEEFKYSLTRTEVSNLIEIEPRLQEEAVEELYSKLSQVVADISIIEDYQKLYDELTARESKNIRSVDITALDLELLDAAIVKGEVTDELKEAIINGVSSRGVELSSAF